MSGQRRRRGDYIISDAGPDLVGSRVVASEVEAAWGKERRDSAESPPRVRESGSSLSGDEVDFVSISFRKNLFHLQKLSSKNEAPPRAITTRARPVCISH